jgi:hypothetical protein
MPRRSEFENGGPTSEGDVNGLFESARDHSRQAAASKTQMKMADATTTPEGS